MHEESLSAHQERLCNS